MLSLLVVKARPTRTIAYSTNRSVPFLCLAHRLCRCYLRVWRAGEKGN